MRLHESVAQLGRDDGRDRSEAADIDRTENLLRQLAGEAVQFLGVAQQGLRLFHDLAARRGQAHALRMVANEQLHLEYVLEVRDRVGNRGLRNVDVLRGAQDAAGLAGRHEIGQLLRRELQAHINLLESPR